MDINYPGNEHVKPLTVGDQPNTGNHGWTYVSTTGGIRTFTVTFLDGETKTVQAEDFNTGGDMIVFTVQTNRVAAFRKNIVKTVEPASYAVSDFGSGKITISDATGGMSINPAPGWSFTGVEDVEVSTEQSPGGGKMSQKAVLTLSTEESGSE
jgi:hypothetical protein